MKARAPDATYMTMTGKGFSEPPGLTGRYFHRSRSHPDVFDGILCSVLLNFKVVSVLVDIVIMWLPLSVRVVAVGT